MVLLYATIAAFAAAYIHDRPLSQFLTGAKWLPLLVLLVVLVQTTLLRNPELPSLGFIVLILLLLGFATAGTIIGPYASSGVFVLMSLGLIVLAAILLAGIIRQADAQDRFFDIVSDVGRVVIAVSFLTVVLGINLGRGGDRFSGWTDNPNSLGLLLAPTLVILVARVLEQRPGWVLGHVPFLGAGLYVLALTESRAAIGWVVISLLALVIVRLGLGAATWLVLVAGIVLVGFGDVVADVTLNALARAAVDPLAVGSVGLLSGRVEVWTFGVELFRDNPLLGLGIGASQPILIPLADTFDHHFGAHFHSSYLTALVETGLLGSGVLIAILSIAVVRGFRQTRVSRKSSREAWAREALPWVLLVGALTHATVETWLLSAGNANTLLLWVVVVLNASGLADASANPDRSHRSTVAP